MEDSSQAVGETEAELERPSAGRQRPGAFQSVELEGSAKCHCHDAGLHSALALLGLCTITLAMNSFENPLGLFFSSAPSL